MPDIISRIKVEAQGADQAAREILKLRDAYVAAGEAARGLSANIGGGGSDPFAKATAAGGGATQGGGNSPADVAMREERSRRYNENVRSRESKNSAMGAFKPSGIQQGFSVAEAMSQGRGGSALGGVMSGLGNLLGGPAGIGLLAGGIAAMGIQKFADSAYGRIQDIFGTGMSQRMGMSREAVDARMLDYSRGGTPIGMVKSFFQAASVAGVDMSRSSTKGAINAAMDAATLLGTDPNALAGLIGALNRSNVNASNVLNPSMLGMATKSFGQANTSLFVQSLQGLIDSASSRGIDLTSGSVNGMAQTMAGLASIGGFSAPGAAAFAQQLQGRGIQAASLSSPEDIIAFSAMRKSGMSVTDTMLAMEQGPEAVNAGVYEYLKQATGGDTDLLRMRMQKYLGPGTTMSQVDRFITTQEEMASMTPEERAAKLGAGTGWRDAAMKTNAETIGITQARQNEMLKEFNDEMLALTKGIFDVLMKMDSKPVYNPYGWQPVPADSTPVSAAQLEAAEAYSSTGSRGGTPTSARTLRAFQYAQAEIEAGMMKELESAARSPEARSALSSVKGAYSEAMKGVDSGADAVTILKELAGLLKEIAASQGYVYTDDRFVYGEGK